MDLLTDATELNLGDTSWTIRTFNPQQLPSQIHETARITNSLISPGCVVRGSIERSVLASGVHVEEGAVIRDSIVLGNSVIGRGAKVDYAIIDTEVSITSGAQVGTRPRAKSKITDDDLTVIGQRTHINKNAKIKSGTQVEPSTKIKSREFKT